MSGAKKNKVFVIMCFKKEYDPVYDAIEKAVKEAGCSCNRSDKYLMPQNIPSKIIRDIFDADILIADISEANPNVYYELGISHTLPKNTIIISQSEEALPFNIRNEFVYKYKTNSDGLELLSYKLKDIIKELLNGHKVPSNIVQEVFETHIKRNQSPISSLFNRVYSEQNNIEVAKEMVEHIERKLNRNKKVIVAICGSGAVGKGTFAKLLRGCIKDAKIKDCSILPTDSYMWSRERRIIRHKIGFDRSANNLDELDRDVKDLIRGNAITVTPYDHKTGMHGPPEKIEPSEILIIEGIYSFHPILNKICSNAETLMYYIYAKMPIAKALKFISDVKDRGHSIDLAIEHALPEYNAYATHILPYARYTNYFLTTDEYWKYTMLTPFQKQNLLIEIEQITKNNLPYDV